MAMTAAVGLPEQGQMVNVRSRKWIVTDVSANALAPEGLEAGLVSPQHLLALSSVEDDGLGEELSAIWELEPGAAVVERVALPDPTGFDPPDQLDGVLDCQQVTVHAAAGRVGAADQHIPRGKSRSAMPPYLSTWLDWMSTRKHESLESFTSRAVKDEDPAEQL